MQITPHIQNRINFKSATAQAPRAGEKKKDDSSGKLGPKGAGFLVGGLLGAVLAESLLPLFEKHEKKAIGIGALVGGLMGLALSMFTKDEGKNNSLQVKSKEQNTFKPQGIVPIGTITQLVSPVGLLGSYKIDKKKWPRALGASVATLPIAVAADALANSKIQAKQTKNKKQYPVLRDLYCGIIGAAMPALSLKTLKATKFIKETVKAKDYIRLAAFGGLAGVLTSARDKKS